MRSPPASSRTTQEASSGPNTSGRRWTSGMVHCGAVVASLSRSKAPSLKMLQFW
jgi:hypothetical protein